MIPTDLMFKKWRHFAVPDEVLTEQLLIESRYTDAVAVATNWRKIVPKTSPVHPTGLEKLTDATAAALKTIANQDPSGKNKYLPWISKAIRNYFAQYLRSPYNRADDAAQPESTDVDYLTRWLTRIKDDLSGTGARIPVPAEGDLPGMSYLAAFHHLRSRNLVGPIDELNTIDELIQATYTGMREMRERDALKALEGEAKNQTDIVASNDDYVLLRPRSRGASCYYGQGTQWCISATRSQNYFDSYTGQGKSFYFLELRHLPQDADNKKLALVYSNNEVHHGNYEPEEVFDRPDDEVGADAVYYAVKANLLWKAIKRSPHYKDELRRLKKSVAAGTHTPGPEDTLRPGSTPQQHVDHRIGGLVTRALGRLGSSGPVDPDEPITDLPFMVEIAKGMGLAIKGDPVHKDDDVGGFETVGDFWDFLQEHISEEVSDIFGSAAWHAENNPAGPSEEDFQRIRDEYTFDHIWINEPEDVDGEGNYYWSAGYTRDLEDIDGIDDEDWIDGDSHEVLDVFQRLLDSNHVYPSDSDIYSRELQLRFDPDYDREGVLENWDSFLNQMSDYDKSIGDISDAEIRDALSDAGLISTASVRELAQSFEDLNLEHFEVKLDEPGKMEIDTTLNVVLPVPAWVKETPDPAAILKDIIRYADVRSRSGAGNGASYADLFIDKVSDLIDRELAEIEAQLPLPGMGDQKRWKEAEGLRAAIQQLSDVNVSLFPQHGWEQINRFHGGPVHMEVVNAVTLPFWFQVEVNTGTAEAWGHLRGEEKRKSMARYYEGLRRLAKWLDQPRVYQWLQRYIGSILIGDVYAQDYTDMLRHLADTTQGRLVYDPNTGRHVRSPRPLTDAQAAAVRQQTQNLSPEGRAAAERGLFADIMDDVAAGHTEERDGDSDDSVNEEEDKILSLSRLLRIL